MKRVILTVLATISITVPAYAGSLTRDDITFINGYVISRLMLLKCPGYVSDDDTPMRNADKLGVDGVRIWDASRAAMLVLMDQDYDRKDIIPEVTQVVRSSLEVNARELKSGAICKHVDNFETLGWLKKK
ncbi:hypothetical protein HY68_38950 [Streptomyces sp. AcH 505]|nr:hypothetical protein HY68_38950 [Streptomyces sp. AcH 505]